LQLDVLLLEGSILHLELRIGLEELGVGVKALLQASFCLCQLLLHRVSCCFLLVSGGLGGHSILQLPPHQSLLRGEVIQVGSLPCWRFIDLFLLLLNVQKEIILGW